MILTYLASPYSHPDAEVRVKRYEAALKAVAMMMNNRMAVFSPIVHSHPVAVAHNLPTDYFFWANTDELMVSKCDTLTVLKIEGWQDSLGVAAEIRFARKHGIPVYYLEETEEDLWTLTDEHGKKSPRD